MIQFRTGLSVVDGPRSVFYPHDDVVPPGAGLVSATSDSMPSPRSYVPLYTGYNTARPLLRMASNAAVGYKAKVRNRSAFDPGKNTTVWKGGLPFLGRNR